jgi:hypothetical protein
MLKYTIKVLVYEGHEFEEDRQGFLSWDKTKQFRTSSNTIRKQIDFLKYKMIPYGTYKKEIYGDESI